MPSSANGASRWRISLLCPPSYGAGSQKQGLKSVFPRSSSAQLAAAEGLADGGATDEAKAFVRRALELDPKNVDAQRMIGMVLAPRQRLRVR